SLTLIRLETLTHYQDKTTSFYGLSQEGIAYIEMATTCGINLKHHLDPHKATTYWVGQQINDALLKGVHTIVIGLGGSATNDAGLGLLMALGVKCYDQSNKEITSLGFIHHKVSYIDFTTLNPLLNKVKIIIASDVTNPLLGKEGATYTYGLQKGIPSEELAYFESGLNHLVMLINNNNELIEGSGAGGGLGYALTLLNNNYSFTSGMKYVAAQLKLEHHLQDCDLLITGEGCLDKQSLTGKAVVVLASYAKTYHIPCIVVCGTSKLDNISYPNLGIDLVMPIVDNIITLQQAKEEGLNNLRKSLIRIKILINLNK
ncbi:MAG: glycerate kinase family protein, partial [Bacilli bacterium]